MFSKSLRSLRNRPLARLQDESGGALIFLTLVLLLMFIASFGYMIDLSFTHSSSTAGQIAFDEAARQGLSASPDWESMFELADESANALLNNSQFTGPYFSNGIGDPNAEYRIWIPTVGTGTSALYSKHLPLPGPQLTDLYNNVFSLAVDPLVGGTQWDTWGNAIILRANLTPFQTFEFGQLLPRTETEVVTIGHQQSRLIYVVVDPTMSALDAAPQLWGNYSFGAGADLGTVPDQLPVYGSVTPPAFPTDGSSVFPAPRSSIPMSTYPPIGGGTPIDSLTGDVLPGFASKQDVAYAVYRAYAAGCDNVVFRMWKDSVVRFIDLLTQTSSYDYFAMVGVAGTVPDISRGTFDESARAPWNLSLGHNDPVVNPNGSFDHELDWYRTIPIHPFITNNANIHTHFQDAVGGFPSPFPWLPVPVDSSGNDGALHDNKNEIFRGYVNTGNPDIHDAATLLGNETLQAPGGGGSGGMGLRASWNNWFELCACSGLYASSPSCNSGSGYCLSDEHYGKPGVHDNELLHDTAQKRYRNPQTNNWCSIGSGDFVNLDDHRNGAQHELGKPGETVRNIIAGLGMGVMNANLPSTRMLAYDPAGTDSSRCWDQDPKDPASDPNTRCWKKPAQDAATATTLPSGCIGGNTDGEGCDYDGGSTWADDWIPDSQPNVGDPRRWDPRLWWAPRYTMLSHSIRHAVDMLSLYSNGYDTLSTNYALVNPIPPENRAVVAFAFRPYDPFIVSTDAGIGITRDQMKNDFRKTLSYALCTNGTEVLVFGLAMDDHARTRWSDFSDVVEEFRSFFSEQANPTGGDLDTVIASGGLAPSNACRQSVMAIAAGNPTGKMARITLDVYDPESGSFTGSAAQRQVLAAQGYRDSVPSIAYELLTKYDLQL